MGDLLGRFQQHLKKEFPFLQAANSRLLLAVSGGVDSVVLTDLFVKSGYNIVIAHCNFQLRGEESGRDEQFVRDLARTYNVEVIVKRFDTKTYAEQQKLSIQEAARKLRYDWFREVLAERRVHSPLSIVHGEKRLQPSIVNRESSKLSDDTRQLSTENTETKEADDTNNVASFTTLPTGRQVHDSRLTALHLQSAIITAHHANDNIETLLINLFRGTGISGLHGIPPKQNDILRPLLFAKREEILAYAKENSLGWVEDSSNASDKYTRNFIRLQMLPAAKEIFSQAEDNLLQNIERFKEAEILYNQAVAVHKSKLLEKKGNEWHVPVLKLKKVNPLNTIVWEIIKDFDFAAAQVTEVLKLLDAGNGSYVASATSRVIKNRNWLIIAPKQTETAQHILIEEGEKRVLFEDGSLEIKLLQGLRVHEFTSSQNTVNIDAADVKFPLLLRKWKQGDYFYPLGMRKKKKLGKFFIDQKLSKTAKEKVWVLEADKKIIWVLGMRIDDRFKITATTKASLQISFETSVYSS